MTGPIARVPCGRCGRLLARRRDGAPFPHRCADRPPARTVGPQCGLCGAFLKRAAVRVTCQKCGTVWESGAVEEEATP